MRHMSWMNIEGNRRYGLPVGCNDDSIVANVKKQ